MVKWLVLWTGSIVVFVVFVAATLLSLYFNERSGIDATAIKIFYTKNLPFDHMQMYVYAINNEHFFRFETITQVNNLQEPALIAFVIPYDGEIKDNSGWKSATIEDATVVDGKPATATVVVKDYVCSQQKPCKFPSNFQFFSFYLNELIDKKTAGTHNVRLKFHDSPPLPIVYEFAEKYNPNMVDYNVGFQSIEQPEVTLVVQSDSARHDSIPETNDISHPPGGTHVNWDLQSGKLHQLDYVIPKEESAKDVALTATATFGIGLSIINLVIYGIEKRKLKLKHDEELNENNEPRD